MANSYLLRLEVGVGHPSSRINDDVKVHTMKCIELNQDLILGGNEPSFNVAKRSGHWNISFRY